MTLQNWEKLFEPHILQRGRVYCEEGAVETLYWDGAMVQATVLGSGRYRVEIELMEGEIADWSCDCPYGEDGTPCKHLAAVFYELETMRPKADAQPQETPLEELVARLTPSKARALLLRLARRDEAAADQIRLAVEPPSPRQLPHWEKRIDRMLARSAGRYEYIDCQRAWEAMGALEEFLSGIAGRLLESGHVWEAFALTGYGFRAAAGCAMDGADGGLTTLFEGCCGLWRAQIEAASPAQRRDMYQWFQKTGQAGPGLGEAFLREARQTLFQAPEFLRENIRELDQMIQEEAARGSQTYSKLPRLVLKKLELMEQLGVPAAELRQTEEAYRRLPEIRRRMLQRLLAEKRHSEAEALLRESKALDSRWPRLVSAHSEALIALYEETGQRDRLVEELQFQVFQCTQRNLTYVKQLKESVPSDQWPALRERLLSGGTLHGGLQEALLELDGLYSRLMRRVAEEESLTDLDRWEAVLRPRFPEEVRAAYARCLEKEMGLANSRKEYAALIACLKKIRTGAGHEDAALAARWRAAYPRRRSMLEELRRAGYGPGGASPRPAR